MAENLTLLYPPIPLIFSRHVSHTTPLNANTVEWGPSDPLSHLLICGTYTLQESTGPSQTQTPQNRSGTVEVFSLTPDAGSFELHQSLDEGAGVLDLKWSTQNSAFCAVNSIGQLSLYGVVCGIDTGLEVKKIAYSQVCANSEGSELCLSCDWVSHKDRQVILSDSLGRLAFMECKSSGEIDCISQWKAHAFEAWVTAGDPWLPHLVYSGGDDAKLRGWDLRLAGSPSCCVFTSTHHSTGVCSIQSHPLREHILASGSFDETLLLWDSRDMNTPLAKIRIHEGGVWRLKWHPTNPNLLLSACMRTGVAVYDFAVSLSTPSITWYREHGSLVYGVDWKAGSVASKPEANVDLMLSQFNGLDIGSGSTVGATCPQGSLTSSSSSSTNRHTVASCSFYDKALHIWSFENMY